MPAWYDPALDFILKKWMTPEGHGTALKTFLETVQGDRSPITEKNFTPAQLDLLRDVVNKRNQREGRVTYRDYGSDPTGPLGLMTDQGQMKNTLGEFKYKQDERGNTVILDQYDFNKGRGWDDPNKALLEGPYGAIRSYAGRQVPEGDGRSVRINIPKK